MSPFNERKQAELRILIAESLNGQLPEEGRARLEALLRQSDAAKEAYIECLSLYVDLHDLTHGQQAARPAGIEARSIDARPPRRRFRLTPFLSLAAAILVLLGVLWQGHHKGYEVATLVDAVDLRASWSFPKKTGQRLRTRQGTFKIKAGVAHLHMDQGVDLILEAPCAFKVREASVLVLREGSVYARVTKTAQGFTVQTQDADIVDLGTEFGVFTNGRTETRVHVIRGEVEVQTPTLSPERILQGRALRIANQGTILRDISFHPETFVRTISSRQHMILRNDCEIDLADIVAGGNGLGTGRPGTEIDPLSGTFRSITTPFEDRQGNHTYHAVSDLPWIDGVFVPDGSQPVQVTSTGLLLDKCPVTNNVFWSEILSCSSRRKGPVDRYERGMVLGGIEYGIENRPGIFMHANLGMTFDLQAMRHDFGEHLQITHFQAIAGISEETNRVAYGDADIWVLLDGKVADKHENVHVDKVIRLDVAIPTTSRFLTLMVTDSGANLSPFIDTFGDWCVFGNPRLTLE